MTDLHKLVAEKFTSGNGIEVERITITRKEYEAALAQPEQKLIGWKDGEPQYVAQPEQEPKLSDASVDTNIPLWGLEPKGSGMVMLHQRKWVGLTDEDINKSWEWAQKSSPYGVTRIETFAKSIETKLKEKNGAI